MYNIIICNTIILLILIVETLFIYIYILYSLKCIYNFDNKSSEKVAKKNQGHFVNFDKICLYSH